MGRTLAIVNPRSAHHRTGKRWPELRKAVEAALGPVDACLTAHPGHATEAVKEALRGGCRHIVSVGGDGTHYEVVNGFFDGGTAVHPEAVMSILPQGTGNDLARTLGIAANPGDLSYLATGEVITADVGRIQIGGEVSHFINSCHIGIGGLVCHYVNRRTKVYGGFFTYLGATLHALVTYRDLPLSISFDGDKVDQPVKDLVIANGQFDGGGMHVAPRARLDSGVFETFLVGPVRLHDALFSLPIVYRGRMDSRPDIITPRQARRITVDGPSSTRIGVDGEDLTGLPAIIEAVPGALRLRSGVFS